MGSAKKKESAARQARIAEMRRAEQARERRNRILTIGASVAVVAALVVGAVVIVQSRDDDSSTASDSKNPGHWTTGKDGVKTWSAKLSQTHVTKRVKYPMTPPAGGDHNAVWQNCNGDVYSKPLDDMNAVHSLEHGAVWVTYTDKAKKSDVDALAAKVKATPYTLMSPYEGQAAPIMLTAWGHQRTVTSASDPNVAKFFEKYVQGEQTPEKGAVCTGGKAQ